MQYHVNGFRTGSPHIAEAASDLPRPGDPLPSHVDVLIVGCGPAGLTLAAQMARFADINTRIIDQRPGPLEVGQADGVACRSMEMFEVFGFADRVEREAYWVNETSFWRPARDMAAGIERSHRIQDVEDDLSEFPHTILNQARIHDFFLQDMAQSPRRLVPDYDRTITDLSIDPDADDYPVTATIRHAPVDASGQDEIVRARYVVGCDGARSAVRRLLGLQLRGDSANKLWGVMDVLGVTDFPDVRLKCAIQSHNGGMLIIPREGGYMARFYIEMDKLAPNERVADRKISPDQLISAARTILHPYSLEVKEIAWWSAYEIGQRVTDSFDDVPPDAPSHRTPCVFIAGDACHTHSPKAGQGMNVSMADSFNLGWKLAAVLRQQSPPSLLHSYQEERHAKAVELIEFDRDMAALISGTNKDAAGNTQENAAIYQQYFTKHGRYTAGVETRYAPSALIGEGAHQHLAKGLVIGKRFHSAPVIRLADAKPCELAHVIKADGRWRLFAFAGEGDNGQAAFAGGVAALCAALESHPRSPLRTKGMAARDSTTAPDADRDSTTASDAARDSTTASDAARDSTTASDAVVDMRAVFQAHHHDLALEMMPNLLKPVKGRLGLIDYEKIFSAHITSDVPANIKAEKDVYELRAIDRKQGCLVVVRPDQYVANILPLDAVEDLVTFFSGVFCQ